MTAADKGRDTPSANQSPLRQIVRRLIGSRRSERSGDHSTARAAAAACDHLYRNLSRWVGPDGCHALFTRARAEALAGYPALGLVQLHTRSAPYVEGVAETVTSHGDDATAEALEAMLVHLVELLSRLVGDDMATRLIERSLAASDHDDTASDNRRKEA